jgi:hypothetical protein
MFFKKTKHIRIGLIWGPKFTLFKGIITGLEKIEDREKASRRQFSETVSAEKG